MTLLGKFMTGLILVMSVMFLSLAISVFATHVNWRAKADAMQKQLDTQQEVNRQLKEKQTDLLAAISLEKQARAFVLASLETKLSQRTDELSQLQQTLQRVTATEGQTAGALVTAQSELSAINEEVKGLRGDVQEFQKDADQKYTAYVKTMDEVNQLRRQKGDLEDRQKPMMTQLAAYRDALGKKGVSSEVLPDGTVRTDVDGLAPKVLGEVIAVGEKNLIEVSVGSDDGMLIGHSFDIYRDGTYLGKATVVKTAPDRCVAELIPEWKRGTIRKGDRISTKFN